MKLLKFKNFDLQKKIRYGISTKKFGSMKNGHSINRKNLEFFLDYLKLSKDAVCMEQVHGSKVSSISSLDDLMIERVDGLITDKINIPLCVVTADCLPILFYDHEEKVIGVAHGGRKGLQSGIIKNMTGKFKKDYNSKLHNIKVGIGPGIEKKCYEVDGQLMDLRDIAHQMLLKEGINKDNIEDIDLCTKCNSDDLYSHRGRDLSARFVTVISII